MAGSYRVWGRFLGGSICFEVVGCGWREEGERAFKVSQLLKAEVLLPSMQYELMADLRKS